MGEQDGDWLIDGLTGKLNGNFADIYQNDKNYNLLDKDTYWQSDGIKKMFSFNETIDSSGKPVQTPSAPNKKLFDEYYDSALSSFNSFEKENYDIFATTKPLVVDNLMTRDMGFKTNKKPIKFSKEDNPFGLSQSYVGGINKFSDPFKTASELAQQNLYRRDKDGSIVNAENEGLLSVISDLTSGKALRVAQKDGRPEIYNGKFLLEEIPDTEVGSAQTDVNYANRIAYEDNFTDSFESDGIEANPISTLLKVGGLAYGAYKNRGAAIAIGGTWLGVNAIDVGATWWKQIGVLTGSKGDTYKSENKIMNMARQMTPFSMSEEASENPLTSVEGLATIGSTIVSQLYGQRRAAKSLAAFKLLSSKAGRKNLLDGKSIQDSFDNPSEYASWMGAGAVSSMALNAGIMGNEAVKVAQKAGFDEMNQAAFATGALIAFGGLYSGGYGLGKFIPGLQKVSDWQNWALKGLGIDDQVLMTKKVLDKTGGFMRDALKTTVDLPDNLKIPAWKKIIDTYIINPFKKGLNDEPSKLAKFSFGAINESTQEMSESLLLFGLKDIWNRTGVQNKEKGTFTDPWKGIGEELLMSGVAGGLGGAMFNLMDKSKAPIDKNLIQLLQEEGGYERASKILQALTKEKAFGSDKLSVDKADNPSKDEVYKPTSSNNKSQNQFISEQVGQEIERVNKLLTSMGGTYKQIQENIKKNLIVDAKLSEYKVAEFRALDRSSIVADTAQYIKDYLLDPTKQSLDDSDDKLYDFSNPNRLEYYINQSLFDMSTVLGKSTNDIFKIKDRSEFETKVDYQQYNSVTRGKQIRKLFNTANNYYTTDPEGQKVATTINKVSGEKDIIDGQAIFDEFEKEVRTKNTINDISKLKEIPESALTSPIFRTSGDSSVSFKQLETNFEDLTNELENDGLKLVIDLINNINAELDPNLPLVITPSGFKLTGVTSSGKLGIEHLEDLLEVIKKNEGILEAVISEFRGEPFVVPLIAKYNQLIKYVEVYKNDKDFIEKDKLFKVYADLKTKAKASPAIEVFPEVDKFIEAQLSLMYLKPDLYKDESGGLTNEINDKIDMLYKAGAYLKLSRENKLLANELITGKKSIDHWLDDKTLRDFINNNLIKKISKLNYLKQVIDKNNKLGVLNIKAANAKGILKQYNLINTFVKQAISPITEQVMNEFNSNSNYNLTFEEEENIQLELAAIAEIFRNNFATYKTEVLNKYGNFNNSVHFKNSIESNSKNAINEADFLFLNSIARNSYTIFCKNMKLAKANLGGNHPTHEQFTLLFQIWSKFQKGNEFLDSVTPANNTSFLKIGENSIFLNSAPGIGKTSVIIPYLRELLDSVVTSKSQKGIEVLEKNNVLPTKFSDVTGTIAPIPLIYYNPLNPAAVFSLSGAIISPGSRVTASDPYINRIDRTNLLVTNDVIIVDEAGDLDSNELTHLSQSGKFIIYIGDTSQRTNTVLHNGQIFNDSIKNAFIERTPTVTLSMRSNYSTIETLISSIRLAIDSLNVPHTSTGQKANEEDILAKAPIRQVLDYTKLMDDAGNSLAFEGVFVGATKWTAPTGNDSITINETNIDSIKGGEWDYIILEDLDFSKLPIHYLQNLYTALSRVKRGIIIKGALPSYVNLTSNPVLSVTKKVIVDGDGNKELSRQSISFTSKFETIIPLVVPPPVDDTEFSVEYNLNNDIYHSSWYSPERDYEQLQGLGLTDDQITEQITQLKLNILKHLQDSTATLVNRNYRNLGTVVSFRITTIKGSLALDLQKKSKTSGLVDDYTDADDQLVLEAVMDTGKAFVITTFSNVLTGKSSGRNIKGIKTSQGVTEFTEYFNWYRSWVTGVEKAPYKIDINDVRSNVRVFKGKVFKVKNPDTNNLKYTDWSTAKSEIEANSPGLRLSEPIIVINNNKNIPPGSLIALYTFDKTVKLEDQDKIETLLNDGKVGFIYLYPASFSIDNMLTKFDNRYPSFSELNEHFSLPAKKTLVFNMFNGLSNLLTKKGEQSAVDLLNNDLFKRALERIGLYYNITNGTILDATGKIITDYTQSFLGKTNSDLSKDISVEKLFTFLSDYPGYRNVLQASGFAYDSLSYKFAVSGEKLPKGSITKNNYIFARKADKVKTNVGRISLPHLVFDNKFTITSKVALSSASKSAAAAVVPSVTTSIKGFTKDILDVYNTSTNTDEDDQKLRDTLDQIC